MAFRVFDIEIEGRIFSVQLLARTQDGVRFELSGKQYDVRVSARMPALESPSSHMSVPFAPMPGAPMPGSPPSGARAPANSARQRPGAIVAPIPGTVVQLPVPLGGAVTAGGVVAVIEAMKMENNVVSTVTGTIKSLSVKVGQEIDVGTLLAEVEAS